MVPGKTWDAKLIWRATSQDQIGIYLNEGLRTSLSAVRINAHEVNSRRRKVGMSSIS